MDVYTGKSEIRDKTFYNFGHAVSGVSDAFGFPIGLSLII